MADVVVVGAGVVGLTAAVRLQQAGARVTVLAAGNPATSVSAVAAAVWYPSHTDADPRVLRWAAATYEEFARQAMAQVPGVVMRPTRMLRRTPDDTVPWWGAVPADFTVLRGGRAPYPVEWRFTVPSVEMGPYLDWLATQVVVAGGTVVRRPVEALAEAFALAPVAVNATGLAAGALCGDPAVHPARGQIVVVDNPGLVTSVRDEDDPAGMTYVHPRSRDVVLGGTYEPGRWDTGPDPEAGLAILHRCRALVPELAGARVLTHRVGLRPARHGGARVAAQDTADGRLVHAYGHGGAGMTVSWGCADEVTGLAACPAPGREIR